MERFIDLNWQVCFLWALAALVLPVQWLISALFAAVIHETGHFLALKIMGVPVSRIRIGISGAIMDTGAMTPGQEILCSMAGPAASFLLWCFHPVFPRLALWALVQGCFNLLPVFPMDGGRIVRSLLLLAAPKQADFISRALGRGVQGVFLITGLIFCRKWGGGLWWVWAGLLLCVCLLRKIPCKESHLPVQ